MLYAVIPGTSFEFCSEGLSRGRPPGGPLRFGRLPAAATPWCFVTRVVLCHPCCAVSCHSCCAVSCHSCCVVSLVSCHSCCLTRGVLSPVLCHPCCVMSPMLCFTRVVLCHPFCVVSPVLSCVTRAELCHPCCVVSPVLSCFTRAELSPVLSCVTRAELCHPCCRPAPGAPTGPCAVCGAEGRPCSRCRVDYYCGKEHQTQDWARHKAGCGALLLRSDRRVGRHLVAARDIPAATVLMRERPLVTTPAPPTSATGQVGTAVQQYSMLEARGWSSVGRSGKFTEKKR